MTAVVKRHSVRGSVLLALREGKASPLELTKMLGMKHDRVRGAIAGLMARGLVESYDGRVGLTLSGIEAIRAIVERAHEVHGRKLPRIAQDDEVEVYAEHDRRRAIVALDIVRRYLDCGMIPRPVIVGTIGNERRLRRVLSDVRAAGFAVDTVPGFIGIRRGAA